MNKRILPLIAALCLTLTGCASLLERSYSAVEPYTDRYWDSTAEDTLRAENYQDLVNSLLMLIEQRSEDGIIRYYAPEDENHYAMAVRAKREVQRDTVLGSYLLSGMTVICVENEGYCTLTYSMTYRSDAQDVSTLMALTDSHSLMDLLRLAVREDHDSITAQFISKTPREEVMNVVEELWQELYRAELEESGLLPPDAPETESPAVPPADGEVPPADSEVPPADSEIPPEDGEAASPSDEGETPPSEGSPPGGEDTPPADGEQSGEASEEGEEGTDTPPADPSGDEPTTTRIQFPPCPWTVRFYPNADFPEIVEILLK